MTKSAKIFYCMYECLKYGELVGIKITKKFIVLGFGRVWSVPIYFKLLFLWVNYPHYLFI